MSASFDASLDPFDDIYRAVGDDLDRVPWASQTPRAELVGWLDGDSAPATTGATRALVIACGLGDDAEELASRGFSVVAFDFAPTAIELCRRRFPESRVDYRVADLMALPESWRRTFDIVVEVNTVQSLLPPDHPAGIAAIADTVAPGGALFLRCTGRRDDQPVDRRPWLLSRRELDAFVAAGLVETSFAEAGTPNGLRQFVVTYQRPVPGTATG